MEGLATSLPPKTHACNEETPGSRRVREAKGTGHGLRLGEARWRVQPWEGEADASTPLPATLSWNCEGGVTWGKELRSLSTVCFLTFLLHLMVG